ARDARRGPPVRAEDHPRGRRGRAGHEDPDPAARALRDVQGQRQRAGHAEDDVRRVPGPRRGPHEPRLSHGGAPVSALRRRGPDQQEPVQELSGRGTAARRARPERQDPARHRRRHAAAPVRRGQQRCERRPRGRSLRPRADPRPRDLHAPRHRSALRPARVVHPVGTRGRGRGARPQRHGDAEDRPRQPAAPGAAPARQGDAAAARARQRRRLLSPAAGGPAEAQRPAARGPGGLRVGVEGAARSARQRVHRKNEEAPGLIMSSRYWELTVAVSPDASEGLTNFVWALGPLGVVERAQPARAIDLGTGSGILAIAAARLGVPSVLAIDSDPDAVASARANVERNGLVGRVTCEGADAAALDAEPAPLLLANLLAAAHCALAPCYARLVAAGGTLVAGGCLDAEADGVTAALRGYGFQRLEARSIEGWTTLAYEHAPLRDRTSARGRRARDARRARDPAPRP